MVVVPYFKNGDVQARGAPQSIIDLAHCHLELAEGQRPHHVAANAAARMEADQRVEGLGERIANEREANAIVNAIAHVEIPEHDREITSRDVRHIDRFNNQATKERIRLTDDKARLP